MRLPRSADMREEAIIEIARQCSADRFERKAYNRELRDWYTRGTATGDRARYNKIRAHVRQAASYLFQSESVRFGLVAPHRYSGMFDAELDTARDDFHRVWHDDGDGLTIADGVEWCHVYPSAIFKEVISGGRPTTCLVPDPADIGVLEADKPFNRQEAIVHFFTMNMAAFRRMIEGHPDHDDLMRLARAHSDTSSEDNQPLTGTVERLVFDQIASDTTSPVYGGGAIVNGRVQPEAMVEAPRILCCEVWVVDDLIQDWRVVTCLAPAGMVSKVIWDRRTPILSGMDPFVQLSLSRSPDYVWGFSEVDELSALQDWRERRMDQVDRLMELQLDPPIVLTGFNTISDERAKRLRTPGGVLTTSIPSAKAERLAPQMPPEAFGEVNEIDKMFADQGGLPILMQGQSDPGIRAGNQVGVMATLASARLRENAMRVERACSEVATLKWRMHRELSDEPLRKPDGTRFLLTQIPRDVVALVASHSASPLYAAAIKQEADVMLKAGAIELPDYVEMKDPPQRDVLKDKARKLAEAKAMHAKELIEIQRMRAERGRSR